MTIRSNIRRTMYLREDNNDNQTQTLLEGFIWDFLTNDVKEFIQGGVAASQVKKFDSTLAKALQSDNRTIEKGIELLKKAYSKRLDKLNRVKEKIFSKIDRNENITQEVKNRIKQTLSSRLADTEEVLGVLNDEKEEVKAEANPEPITTAEEPPIEMSSKQDPENANSEIEPGLDGPSIDDTLGSEDSTEPEGIDTKDISNDVEGTEDPLEDGYPPIAHELHNKQDDALNFLVNKSLISEPAQERFVKLSDANKKKIVNYAIEQMMRFSQTLQDLKGDVNSIQEELQLSDFGDFKDSDFEETDIPQIQKWMKKNLKDAISKQITKLHREQVNKKKIKEGIVKSLVMNEGIRDIIPTSGIKGSLLGKDIKVDDQGVSFEKGDLVSFEEEDIKKYNQVAHALKNKTLDKTDMSTDNTQQKIQNTTLDKISAVKSNIKEQDDEDYDLKELKKILLNLKRKDKRFGVVKKIEEVGDITILHLKIMKVERSKTDRERIRLIPTSKTVKILAADAEMVRKRNKLPERVKKVALAMVVGAGAGLAFLQSQGKSARSDEPIAKQ